jgi:hypothetical protein
MPGCWSGPAAERGRPDGERLAEFRDSALPSLELRAFNPEPVYPDLEEIRLADSLGYLVETLGIADPLVARLLDGLGPADRAAALVAGCRLGDPAERRRLFDAAPAAVAADPDPLLQVMREIDGEARALRQSWEALAEIKEQAYARIATARFAILGETIPPDATGTLRLSYGAVRGYTDRDGEHPFQTTLGGLFERHEQMLGREPFALPERWLARRERLDPTTPMVFASTHDIVGGNSGSPTVNARGEWTGLVFDGNIHAPARDYAYEDRRGRSLHVHAAAILAALREVYDAGHLADELLGGP